MQQNVTEYQAEKEARERRLMAYTQEIQERTLRDSADIIKTLVEERREQRLTQQDISDMIGVLPSNLARFESGTRVPTLVLLQKYAAALGKHIELRICDNEEE